MFGIYSLTRIIFKPLLKANIFLTIANPQTTPIAESVVKSQWFAEGSWQDFWGDGAITTQVPAIYSQLNELLKAWKYQSKIVIV